MKVIDARTARNQDTAKVDLAAGMWGFCTDTNKNQYIFMITDDADSVLLWEGSAIIPISYPTRNLSNDDNLVAAIEEIADTDMTTFMYSTEEDGLEISFILSEQVRYTTLR